MIREDAGGGRVKIVKPKKKKKQQVTYLPNGGKVVNGKPVAPPSAPPPPKPQAPPKPKVVPPSVVLKPLDIEREDPMLMNVANLTTAAQNQGISLTAKQAMELLSSTDKGWGVNEWGKMLVPGLAPDPYTGHIKQVLRDWYEWTGNLPDAKTAAALLQKTKPGEAVDLKLAPWNPKSKTLLDVLSNDANDVAQGRADNNPNRVGGKKGNRWSLKDIEKWGSVEKADYMRALANAPQRTLGKEWEADDDGTARITNNDIDRINDAREWYGGTSLKHIINKRQAEDQKAYLQSQLVNADGTSNKAAVKALASLTGQSNQDLRNPHTFTGLRDKAFGKDELNKRLQNDMNIFGAYLSTLYPDLKPNKEGNYIWNGNFDKKASLFMFQSNIGYAVAENPYDEKTQHEKWADRNRQRDIAMANISIATHGAIKTDDNLRTWMQDAGFLSPEGNTAMFSDRFTKWLFEDCYLKTQVPKGQSMEMSIFKFVQDWGNGNPKSLPDRYQKYYDDVTENFAFTIANAQGAEANGVNPLGMIFEAEIEQLDAWRNGLIPARAPSEDGRTLGPVVGTVPADKTDVARDRGGTALPSEQQEPLYYEKNGVQYTIGEDGKFHVKKNTARKIGGKGYNPGGKVIDIEIEPGSFMETWMFEVVPKLAWVYEAPMEWPLKAYNRVYMTLALMGAHGGGHSTTTANIGTFGLYGLTDREAREAQEKENREHPFRQGSGERLGAIESGAAALYAANPARITVPLELNQYSWSSITDAFNEAGRMAEDINNMPWAKESLSRMGIDPEVNPAAVFWTDFAWSFALDLMMDAGVGAVARATTRTTASVMRKLSSKKLLAHVAAVEDLPEVQGVGRLMDKARDAERNGEFVLAQTLRGQAYEVYEQGQRGKVQQALRKLETMGADERAKVQAKADILLQKKNVDTVLADLKLMERPAWYDTMALSLSSSQQHPIAVAEILGLRRSMVDEDNWGEYDRLLDVIANSLDHDDTIIAMNRLAHVAKVDLDPGRHMIGKMLHFNSLQYGNNAYDEFFTVLPRENRISGGLADAEHHALTFAQATRMGLPPGHEREGLDQAWDYIKKLTAIQNDASLTAGEKAIRRKFVWDDMMKQIEANVRAQPKSEGLFNDIVKYAKRNGMDTTEFEHQFKAGEIDMWGLFNAYRLVKNHQSLGRILARTGNKTNFFDEVQSSVPWLLAGRHTKGQQAQDLLVKFNLQDLASFMHGKAAHQMKIYSRAGIGSAGMLPSMMTVANVGRTFAVASLAFPFSALFIDEIWRFIPELAKGKLGLGKLKASKEGREAVKEANKEFVERFVATDAVESMVHEAHEFVPIVARDNPAEYAQFVNRWIKAFGKTDFHEEFHNFTDTFLDEMKSHGMTQADIDRIPEEHMKAMFKQHLMDFIFDENNADVRAVLSDTRRGLKHDYGIPDELQSQMDDFEEQIAYIDEMFTDHQAEWHDVRKELAQVRSKKFDVSQVKLQEVQVPLSDSAKRRALKSLGPHISEDATLSGFVTRFKNNPNERTYGELRDAIVLRLRRQRDDMEKEITAHQAELDKATQAAAPKPTAYDSKPYKTKGRAEAHAHKKADELGTTVFLNKEKDGTWTVSTTNDTRSMDSVRPKEQSKPAEAPVEEAKPPVAREKLLFGPSKTELDQGDRMTVYTSPAPNGLQVSVMRQDRQGLGVSWYAMVHEAPEPGGKVSTLDSVKGGDIGVFKSKKEAMAAVKEYHEKGLMDDLQPGGRKPGVEEAAFDVNDPAKAEFINDWLLENVDGLKYNRKTGEWNTKAYQREGESHAQWALAGGNEYEDDVTVIDEIISERIDEIQSEWERLHPEDVAAEAPTTAPAATPERSQWIPDPQDADNQIIGQGEYRIELKEYGPGLWGATVYKNGKEVPAENWAMRGDDYFAAEVAQAEVEKKLDELVPATVVPEEPIADFTEETVEAAIDEAPTSPPADGIDPDIEFMTSQRDAVDAEIARLEDPKKGPKFRTEVIDKPFRTHETTLTDLIGRVRRPTNRAWIFNWLDENGFRSTYPNIYADGARMGGRDAVKGSFSDPTQVKKWFAEMGLDESVYNRMFYDFKAERLASYGIDITDDIIQQDADLVARMKYLTAHKKELRAARKELVDIGPPKPNQLNKEGEAYLDSVVDRNFLYYQNPVLWDALENGKELTTKDIIRLTGEGVQLPDVAGVRGRKAGWFHSNGEIGWVPVLSAYAERVPYRIMNWMGNRTRQAAFLGNFKVEYNKLIARGVGEEQAISAAQARAMKYTESVMYSPGQTLRESQLGAYFYFLPAYRQAIKYWSKEFMRHPFVYTELRNRFGTDMPNQYWDGNYGTYMPMPMFLTNNPAEMVVPGLTLPLLMPLRIANSLSGWRHVKEDPTNPKSKWKWQFTGETKFDGFSDGFLSPITGFASKNVSPLSFFDDLIYGAWGESTYGTMESDHLALAAFASLGYALRKDPMERRKAAVRIMQAQMAKGYRPDLDAYQANIEGSPWWYELLAGAGFDNPEAILAAISRQFFIRKVNYSPMDINIDPDQNNQGFFNLPGIGDKVGVNFWKTHNIFEDGEARTMMDAEMEYFEADGNPAKQKEILSKYPKLRAKYEFFSKDAYERELYLNKPENRWLIPYISGKTMYDEITGAPLTQGEYYDQMTRGAAIQKSNRDYMEGVSQKYLNAEWSVTLTAMEEERDRRLKAADKTFRKLIKKYAGNPITEKNWMESYEGYAKGWWGDLPPEAFANGRPAPLYFMNDIAKAEYGRKWKEHLLKIDPQAIQQAHYWGTREVGAVDPNRPAWAPKGEKPVGAYQEGTEQFYSNATFKKFKYEEGAGKHLRIQQALNRFLEPDDRAIFNTSNSMSIRAIKEARKKHNAYRKYALDKILNKAYYEINSAAEIQAAIPGIFDRVTGIGTPEEMDHWLVLARKAYDEKQAAAAATGVLPDYYSDAYEAAKKKYDKEMARLMKMPIAKYFREGAASMLMQSDLVKTGTGKPWSKRYATATAKRLFDKDVDYDDLVDAFRIGKTTRPKNVESANAWASIFIASLAGRDRIEAARKADDGHIGDTQRLVATRLSKYADAWARRSDRFRSQWGEQGGTEMIKKLLGIW